MLRLLQMFKWQFIGATLARFICDILQYVNPLLLGVLITFIEDVDAAVWKGVVLALLMFATAEFKSILANNYFISMYRIGVKAQSILTLAVYEKVECWSILSIQF